MKHLTIQHGAVFINQILDGLQWPETSRWLAQDLHPRRGRPVAIYPVVGFCDVSTALLQVHFSRSYETHLSLPGGELEAERADAPEVRTTIFLDNETLDSALR